MNEAFDPKGSASDALFALRLITGQGETNGVAAMYAEAARLHGACTSDCNAAEAEGRRDRAEAEAASTTTLFSVDEIMADLHGAMVAARRRQSVCGLDRGTRYLVGDENTLCSQLGGDAMVGIMAAILDGKGGLGRSWRDGMTHPGTFRTIRAATLEDFQTFRVSPKGHLVS
ncbi:hypothetical protein [Rhodanobacter sp. FW106-PBR-R2A-1-13]|uniref:hypothetical protein n=1 Tax=Rhodanobacter sp. FW106-PBR-R2A-1-13 TaxID=3454845 RepID=UPI0034E4A9C9